MYSWRMRLSGLIMRSYVKHLVHCTAFICYTILVTSFIFSVAIVQVNTFDPWEEYGFVSCCILILTRILVLLALPQVILNVLGLLCFNAFDEKVTLNGTPLLAPLICIRVVTRGNFPHLVKENVMKNMAKCSESGLENFILEVVTDKRIGLPPMPRVREIVVPTTYLPESGALYKARALQYCLQDDVNVLSDNDYIVHLDEETLMTKNSVRGILNFVIEKKYDFGQGVITYANDQVVNWFTTLADSMRVAEDFGKLRAQFYFFHKPVLSWKGSFIVARAGAEKDVSFDHGINGSIAEDCYFAMRAYMKGYTFNFIGGEMWEKSPFTVWDFIQQRKRWVQGISLVVGAPEIPWKYKIWLASAFYAWISMPVSVSSILLSVVFPLALPNWISFICVFIGATNVYLYVFGLVKSLSVYRAGLSKYLLCLFSILFVVKASVLLESTAVLMGTFGSKRKFYIVNKDISKSTSVTSV